MLNETQQYLLTLTEKDAQHIIANAKQEAGINQCFWKKTEAYYTYQNAIKELRQMVRDGHRLSVETLKFVYYINKMEHTGTRLFTGMGEHQGTM